MSHFDRQRTPTPKLAFPALVDLGTGLQCADFGMTLLDWFAGQALAGLMACPDLELGPGRSFAELAYRQADAMMKARDAV